MQTTLFDTAPRPAAPGTTATVVSLFAGPGGWCEGLTGALPELADAHVGVELDPAACRTRHAAGHRTVCGDVRRLGPAQFAGTRLLIASPPCQTFSTAGKRAGLGDDYQHALDTVTCLGDRCGCAWETVTDVVGDARTALVAEPLRWVNALEAHGLEWLLLEQVPAAEYLWEDLAAELYARDWATVDVAIVDAADYGVPQHRRRAVLVAARTGCARIPPATHGPNTTAPYATPESVLGLHGTLGFPRRNDRDDGGTYRARDLRATTRPAFTLTEKVRSWRYVPDDPAESTRQLTLAEIAQLQSFRADYPFTGSRSAACLQAANAVPPLLAQRLIEACLDLARYRDRTVARLAGT